jgi:hypothetical protein
VLPFELLDIAPTRAVHKPYRPPQLPLYVEPLPDEALLSWLLRLATRLRVSIHALSSYSFGVDDRGGHTRWWLRPHPWLLAKISERTGVAVTRLRKMTLSGTQPVYRDDEASGRFCGRRYEVLPPDRRMFRFAVCCACIEEDERPYLRSSWLIGWTGVCATHNVQLIERCEHCKAGLRVDRWATVAVFAPGRCIRCGEEIHDFADVPADPSASALQQMMLSGKCDGYMEIPGLPKLMWRDFVATRCGTSGCPGDASPMAVRRAGIRLVPPFVGMGWKGWHGNVRYWSGGPNADSGTSYRASTLQS